MYTATTTKQSMKAHGEDIFYFERQAQLGRATKTADKTFAFYRAESAGFIVTHNSKEEALAELTAAISAEVQNEVELITDADGSDSALTRDELVQRIEFLNTAHNLRQFLYEPESDIRTASESDLYEYLCEVRCNFGLEVA